MEHQGRNVTDGQSEASPAAARALGLLPEEVTPETPGLYSPWQFRGVLPTSAGATCLAKGMLMVDPLLANGLHIRRECAKVESVETLETEDVNFDVVATTEAAMKPATVNSQLVAALTLRALSAELAADREHLWAMLEQLCSKLALDTVDSMKAQAWGLTDPTQAPPKSGRRLGPRRPTRADAQVAVAEQEHKNASFSPKYWRARHLALLDLQRQVGLPFLFRTRAPYERPFPYHAWVMDEMAKAGRGRQKLAGPETLHMATSSRSSTAASSAA